MARGAAKQSLPPVDCFEQDCQIEREYTQVEWAHFVECAMRHWEAGHGIDDEFEPKRKKHGITYRDVKRTINQSAELIAYEHWGCNRIGIWRKETGVLLILRIREGDALALYSAQDYEDIHDPMGCGEMTNIRWLKQ